MVAALTAVSAAMREQNDLGGKWDSQESKFRAIRQQVDEALSLPDDVVVTPEPVVVTQEQDDRILALVAGLTEKVDSMITAGASTESMLMAVSDKIDGMEDVLAALALSDEPAPTEPATEETPA